jgi:septal ring factor EnvC (AmiA/AmiB activator)
MYTPGNWSRATPTIDVFNDEPRRCVTREAVALGRTLQRTETAVLEVQIAALHDVNESLDAQLDRLREERDQLRRDCDHWRKAAEQMKRQLGRLGLVQS